MTKPRVAIIGAGPSGLTSIKQCIEDDLEPVCFEESKHTGGLWRYTEIDDKNQDPHSSIYKSVIIITSKDVMAFTDFPVPDEWSMFLHNSKVKEYFDLYIEHFKLAPYIRFQSPVQKLSIQPDNKWKVTYLNPENEECEEIFEYVMVCTGHHRYPRFPKYTGMDKFPGKQLHSHFYRRPTNYNNKRVVVVGCGNSAMDISVELSGVASQVYLCSRNGTLPWILPRRIFGNLPSDHLTTRFYSYLPISIRNLVFKTLSRISVGPYPTEFAPKSEPSSCRLTIKTEFMERVSTGTIILKPNISELKSDNNNSISFVDGSVLSDIDEIIYATGYDIKFPFLDKETVSGGEKVEQQFNEEYRENLVWLYKYIFPPKLSNIAFIGLIQTLGGIMPVSDLQAQYVTSSWTGKISLPNQIEMEKDIEKYQKVTRKYYKHSARHTIQADMIPYMDELAKEIGCLPSLSKVFLKYGPKLWFQVLFGVPSPAQYRLFGRQSWDGAAKTIQRQNEVSPAVRIWGYYPLAIIFAILSVLVVLIFSS